MILYCMIERANEYSNNIVQVLNTMRSINRAQIDSPPSLRLKATFLVVKTSQWNLLLGTLASLGELLLLLLL
jgi:hypothetical protein